MEVPNRVSNQGPKWGCPKLRSQIRVQNGGVPNRGPKSWSKIGVQNQGPKWGCPKLRSKIRVQNRGPKLGSQIGSQNRVQNRGPKSGSQIGVPNRGPKSGSHITPQIRVHIMLRDELTQKFSHFDKITVFGYPRTCKFRKPHQTNQFWSLRLPTFFKM
jgi:hypothetical protein